MAFNKMVFYHEGYRVSGHFEAFENTENEDEPTPLFQIDSIESGAYQSPVAFKIGIDSFTDQQVFEIKSHAHTLAREHKDE